jgi:hypothetical protein
MWGGKFAMIAFGWGLFGLYLNYYLAHHSISMKIIKPLSVIGMLLSAYTILNGFYYTSVWDGTEIPSDYAEKWLDMSEWQRGIIMFFNKYWPWVAMLWGAAGFYFFSKHYKDPASAYDFLNSDSD